MLHGVSGDLGIRKDHTFSTYEFCCIQKVPFPQEAGCVSFLRMDSYLEYIAALQRNGF